MSTKLEGDYGLAVIKSVVERSRKRLDEEFAETMIQSPSLFGLKYSWSLYVACFSAGEQPYMWKNYACEHTGFAISFDHDRIIGGAMGGKKYALFRVLYDRPTQEQRIEATLNHAIAMELTMNLLPAERRRFWMERVAVALIVCASRFKAPKWSREEEFRISVTDPLDILKFDSGGKSRVRISFVRSAVTRVTRGTKCAADLDVATVRDLLDRHGYGADVQIVDARS